MWKSKVPMKCVLEVKRRQGEKKEQKLKTMGSLNLDVSKGNKGQTKTYAGKRFNKNMSMNSEHIKMY